jgi:hypothetical protein
MFGGRHDTEHNDVRRNDTQHEVRICDTEHKWQLIKNDTQHNNALSLCWVSRFIYHYAVIMLSVVMLAVVMLGDRIYKRKIL